MYTVSPEASTNSSSFFFAAGAQLIVNPMTDRIVSANQETCRLVGQDLSKVLQYRASELFSDSFTELLIFTQELMVNGRGRNDRLLLRKAAGNERVEVIARCVTSDGELLLYLCLQSVTELDSFRDQSDADRFYRSGLSHWSRVSRIFQEFEYEHQLLLDAAGDGIYGVDVHGMTTFVNPAAQNILGYSSDELAGKNMHETVHHSHSDGSHFGVEDCPIFSAFRDGLVKSVADDVFWNKSGKPVDVEYTSTPIREREEIVGAVVVFRDVSQKKIYERKLLAALTEVETLKNRLQMEKAYLQEEISSEFNHHRIIGRSPQLMRSLQQIELVGPTDATVLITGESGTGKELIARAIHETSARSERPLIRVNCAAIPADLFESEFFGHVKGSFTGATADRPGRFDLADGGTLFLDEVGEIPLHLQGKLLRVLQEQQFERIGDSTTRKVDVRIVAATNLDLLSCVAKGSFREDLYFRLNVFPLESIPLRHRREDIPLLTQHFLKKSCTRASKLNLKISVGGMKRLQDYNWPGNIRELENVIERQVILTTREMIGFDELAASDAAMSSVAESERTTVIFTEAEIKQQERGNILRALEKTQGKVFGQGGAAQLLQMKPTTLASRIKKYRINVQEMAEC